MFQFLRKIIQQNPFPLNKILVSKQNLIGNYRYLSGLNPKIKIAPVLKSNAYGHGIGLVGKILDSEKPPLICVDSLIEARQLKKSGVKSEILIMGYVDPKSIKFNSNYQFAVFSADHAQRLNSLGKKLKIHIFVDTGMNREGIKIEDFESFLKALSQFKCLTVTGLMSHLAVSQDPHSKKTNLQIKNFKKAKEHLLKFSLATPGLKIKWFHLGGSFALINEIAKDTNLIRVGRAIYGFGPNPLNPALRLTTKLAQIKKIKKGDTVGYSETFKAVKDLMVGILPVGYNDGVDRRLSNKGVVLIGNVECPIVGLISMNVTTINISAVKRPFLGQEVLVFSDNKNDKNSFGKSSELIGTIPHELMIHLNPQTRRELI